MFKPSRNTVLSYHPVLEKSSFFFLFLHNPNDLFIQKDFLFIYIPIVMCCKIVPSLFHLFFGCKLLFPPAQVIDPVRLPAAVKNLISTTLLHMRFPFYRKRNPIPSLYYLFRKCSLFGYSCRYARRAASRSSVNSFSMRSRRGALKAITLICSAIFFAIPSSDN